MSVINGADETESQVLKEWYVANRKIPLARPGEAKVARVAVFLASEEAPMSQDIPWWLTAG
jgi:hypothetical protein